MKTKAQMAAEAAWSKAVVGAWAKASAWAKAKAAADKNKLKQA